MKNPLVSVVIPTHNRKEKLIRLINSIIESDYPKDKLEIIVVDDASTDGTYECVKKKFSEVKIIRNENELLPSESRNIGIKNARGDYIFLIDDDNIVDKNCISTLVNLMESNHNIGLIGPLALFYSKPDTVWCGGGMIDKILYTQHHLKFGKSLKMIEKKILIYCDYIPNAYMTKKEILKKIGGFDQKNFPIAMEEVDLAYKIRSLGYYIAIVPEALVWHDVPLKKEFHITRKRSYFRGRSRALFYKKYAKWRLLIIFIDIISFGYLLLKYSKDNKWHNFISYLRGVMDGINSKISD